MTRIVNYLDSNFKGRKQYNGRGIIFVEDLEKRLKDLAKSITITSLDNKASPNININCLLLNFI